MNKLKIIIITAIVILIMLLVHIVVPWSPLQLKGCMVWVLGLGVIFYGNRSFNNEE